MLAFVGSRWMPGAAILVARAAQRAGAGLVSLAVPDASLVAPLVAAAPEATFLPLDEHAAPPRWPECHADVRLVGCGRGDDERTRALVHALVRDDFDGPLVVDADGLNAARGEPERLRRSRGALVMTPHPGEAARLLGAPVGPGDAARLAAAHALARRAGGFCVLKGARTVVSDGARAWVAHTGNAGMATAGAGDVLAGIVAAYLCAARPGSGFEVFDAVRAAVHVHGLAGDLAARSLGRRALIASDLVAALPAAQEAHRAGEAR